MSVGDLKKHKEKSSSDFSSYKEQLDRMMKQFNFQIESHESSFKEYSRKTLQKFEKMHKNSIQDFTDKIDEVKLENGKYSLELMKKFNIVKEKIQEIEKIKESLNQFWEEELEKVKSYHNKKFEENLREILRLKKKLEENSNSLKVLETLKFRKIMRI